MHDTYCCERTIAHDVIIRQHAALNVGKRIYTGAGLCSGREAFDNNLYVC